MSRISIVPWLTREARSWRQQLHLRQPFEQPPADVPAKKASQDGPPSPPPWNELSFHCMRSCLKKSNPFSPLETHCLILRPGQGDPTLIFMNIAGPQSTQYQSQLASSSSSSSKLHLPTPILAVKTSSQQGFRSQEAAIVL